MAWVGCCRQLRRSPTDRLTEHGVRLGWAQTGCKAPPLSRRLYSSWGGGGAREKNIGHPETRNNSNPFIRGTCPRTFRSLCKLASNTARRSRSALKHGPFEPFLPGVVNLSPNWRAGLVDLPWTGFLVGRLQSFGGLCFELIEVLLRN